MEIAASISREYAQGDTWVLTFTTTDENGAAADITGLSARFEMARRVGGTGLVGTQLSPASATAALTTPASGIFTITVSKTITATLLGDYYFEAKLVDTSVSPNVVSTSTRGYFTVVATQRPGG